MATPLSEEELDAWRALLRAHGSLIAVLERELLCLHGMPITFYEVLVNLSDAGGRLRMNELADRILLSRSGLTRLIDRMEKAGFVTRESCPSDRRGALAVLTTDGREALERAWPDHARGVDEHLARHLQPGDAKALTEILGRIARQAGCGAPSTEPGEEPASAAC